MYDPMITFQAKTDSNLSKELDKLKRVEEEGKTRLDKIRELEEELRQVELW